RLGRQPAGAGVREEPGAEPAGRRGARGRDGRLTPPGSAVPPPTAAPDPRRASVAELREQFRSGKAALLNHFAESRATAPAATALLRALAKHVDQTLADLWAHAGMPSQAALLAV